MIQPNAHRGKLIMGPKQVDKNNPIILKKIIVGHNARFTIWNPLVGGGGVGSVQGRFSGGEL
jgi:hypothetical protein